MQNQRRHRRPPHIAGMLSLNAFFKKNSRKFLKIVNSER
ncbi:hypothetical protein ASZ90_008081 [hydrocarbon metagenome]|uniref:Uncharacterized protein n=1 Tax=hydrocarbon metagenome TaxID=938273 RepID=A0A0W8FML9_9ZZZZ